jgi:RNA polymerase sigma-70 factor (ECF subfamily)
MALALTDDAGRYGATEQISDDQLMLAYRRGDKQAFDALYTKYKNPLHGYLYRHCNSESQMAELFQDVWVRVIASSSRFEGSGRFRSWIFTLAHNCLVDFYRKNEKQQLHTTYEESAGGKGPDDEADGSELRSALDRSLQRLPLDQRQAFCLREEQGFSIKEIAVIQNVTAEAAKSRLRYAYKKLKASMGGKDRETK